MPTPPLSDEDIMWAVEAVNQYGGETAAAKATGRNRNQIRIRLRRAAEKGLITGTRVLPGYVIKSLASKDADGTWIKQTKEPGEVFETPASHKVSGLSVLTDAEGRVVQKWTKTKSEPDPLEIVAAIKAAFEGWEPRAEIGPAPICEDADLATMIIISDAHVGLLCAKEEVGENWNTKRAQRVLGDAITRLVASSPPSKVGVVLGLGDLLHADGYDHRTPQSKNPLDVDGRYPLILKVATRLIITAVTEALAKHETVIVRVLSGNHDTESSVAVALALSLYYEGEARVIVDDDPSRYWWFEWGSNFVGATHGDAVKMRDLPLVMASRNPAAWGRSKFRAIYTGHIHSQQAYEVGGVTVESFQAPVPADFWHHSAGYGAGRSLNSITLHREHGEIGRNKVNIIAQDV